MVPTLARLAQEASVNWRRILIHHSATGPGVTAAQIREFHVKQRGWQDIGYHGVILGAPHGFEFAPGRSLAIAGAHCPGQNSIALGLCLVGNFTLNPPPSEQLNATALKCADWCLEFGIEVDEIHAHRQHRATECPGLVPIKELRSIVRKLMAFG